MQEPIRGLQYFRSFAFASASCSSATPGFIAALKSVYTWLYLTNHQHIILSYAYIIIACAKTYRISRAHSSYQSESSNLSGLKSCTKIPLPDFFQFIVWLDSLIWLESSMSRFDKTFQQGLRLADGALQFEPCSVWELLLPLQPVLELGGSVVEANLKLFEKYVL